jgi:hypothetical protein
LYASTLSCKRTSFAAESMTRQSRPVRRLLALLDPLLGRPALVVNADLHREVLAQDDPGDTQAALIRAPSPS